MLQYHHGTNRVGTILYEDNDLNGLVKSMIELANDVERVRIYGKESRRIVKDFDVKKCADNYYDIYSSLCKKETQK